MKKENKYLTSFFAMKNLFIAVIFIAAILRLWDLSNVPPSPSMDEASIGYNAYSVIKTGGDEYGQMPGLLLRAFDDWRRSAFLFLTIPFTLLFNLNVLSVRLPSVLLSLSSVIAVYFIVQRILKKSPEYLRYVPLLCAFLVAISPWHIYISRLGHEVNAYLAFFILGVYFFQIGLKNFSFLILSLVFFVLSMISYNSGQLFIPLFGLGIFLVFRKEILERLFENKKTILITLLSLVVSLSIALSVFSSKSLVRFEATSIFNPDVHSERLEQRRERFMEAKAKNDLIGVVANSEKTFPLEIFLEGYSSHFRTNWLFLNVGSDPHKVPNLGLLYLWEGPFLIIGALVLLLSRRIDTRAKIVIFLWFILAPLPASITTQYPHAMRAFTYIPIYQLLTALGLVWALNSFGTKIILRNLFLTCLVLLVGLGMISFAKNYFITFPKEQSDSFHYALKEVVPFVLENENNYKKIIFSNQDNLYQSYMIFLYHSNYDPLLYKEQGGTISGGYNETHKFGKFEFRPIDWIKEEEDNLYIGNPSDFPPAQDALFEGKFLNGKTGVIVTTK